MYSILDMVNIATPQFEGVAIIIGRPMPKRSGPSAGLTIIRIKIISSNYESMVGKVISIDITYITKKVSSEYIVEYLLKYEKLRTLPPRLRVERTPLSAQAAMSKFANMYRLDKFESKLPWKKDMYNTDKNWIFSVSSKHAIDFNAVEDEMSKNNPVVILNAGTHCVIGIHYMLKYKASLIKKNLPGIKVNLLHNAKVAFYELDIKDLDTMIKWCRELNRAKWPKKENLTYEVNFPNV